MFKTEFSVVGAPGGARSSLRGRSGDESRSGLTLLGRNGESQALISDNRCICRTSISGARTNWIAGWKVGNNMMSENAAVTPSGVPKEVVPFVHALTYC